VTKKEGKRIRAAQINAALLTDEAMSHFMIDVFGRGNFVFDPAADVWVAVDRDYAGEGRGFVVVQRGGDWSHAVIPAGSMQ
jgi:hypothetical protein